MRTMEYRRPNSSTYSAIFATLLIVLIVSIITYNAVQKIYKDHKEIKGDKTEKEKKQQTEESPDAHAKEGTVLYENLTDEEADQIISKLLQSGEENFKKAEDLKKKIEE